MPIDRRRGLSRRALLAGAAWLAALPPVHAAAAMSAPGETSMRLMLPAAPFIGDALSAFIAAGRLGADELVAAHLDGIEAYRPSGEPLTIGDIDAMTREVDRFLAILLIEQVSGVRLAEHLQHRLRHVLGLRDARVRGSAPGLTVDCKACDGMPWLDARRGPAAVAGRQAVLRAPTSA